MLTSLQEQGIENVNIEILKDILYGQLSDRIHLHKESEKIRIKKGVRQVVRSLRSIFCPDRDTPDKSTKLCRSLYKFFITHSGGGCPG